ncbi:TonB-dependent receptor [Luteimonas salinilitoris]|uniref:TonB-dependent receptor n=1 Tax=Luteimonas salinilitoris TaxID=3237697 RepID=A0ABV4HS88_9GAMM
MTPRHPLPVAIAMALVAAASNPVSAQSTAAPTVGHDDAVTLDTLEVRPQFESQMRAIDFKRSSDAIQDTVSSDSMGQYPDKNVGESLQRLPGISVTRDQGEGRFVVVRGLDAGLNSVSVDGVAVGTPEDSIRAAPLDVIPSDSTERLTVIKSPTPDMPGDSIGGTILIESASAFDREGRNIRAKAELGHQSLSGITSPKASFNYSDIFGGGTFGVAFGVSYQDRNYESDNIEVEYDKDEDVSDGLIPIEVQQRKYSINRERTGVNLNLDWRPDDSSSYYLRTLYTDFTDAETRQNSIVPVGEGDFAQIGDGVYEVTGIDPGDFSRRVRWRTKEEETFTVSAGGENRFDAFAVDYKLGYTQMRERVEDEVESRFDYDGDDDVSLILDQRSAVPTYTIADSPAGGWLRNDNYAFDRFVVAPIWVDDDEYSAALNVRFDTDRVTWKAGVLGRWRERDVNIDERELRVGPDINLGSWTSNPPSYAHGNMGDGIGSGAMNDYLRRFLDQYSERPQDAAANTEISLIEDYVANEDILAGYLMGTVDFGGLRVIAGARVETTDFEATGNVVDLEDEETIGSIGKRNVSSSYTNVLPGLHLRYDTQNDWVFRGAYTHTIARPSFGDISPRTRINRDDEEVELGNPDLDPYKSRNLDFSAERYIGESGIFSVGVFHKDIEGYIAETSERSHPDYADFDVTMPVNGDDASVLGVELNWQQHFDNGLLFGASATWLDTEFSLLPGVDRAGEKFALPRASDRLYSAHIGYEQRGLSVRLAAVYRSEYLDEIDSDDPDFDIWVAENTQLDFTLDYKVSDEWGFFFEASNLLDEPLELYQGSPANTLQNELYGRTYVVGAKLRF